MNSLRPASLALLFSAAALSAQVPLAPPAAVPPAEPVALGDYLVTASPLARAWDEIAQPTSVLAGHELARRLQPTIGETLAQEPGISSTYFGPGASRPIIRGLGGDRVRVLTGGVGTLDASVVSPDHAVSLDPILVDRIEVVRGPATLLYGGSALGGVVNVIDARIPESLPDRPVSGRIETRYGSAAEERAVAGLVNGRAGGWVWHLDGFARETADLHLPGFGPTPSERAILEAEGVAVRRGRLTNSATRASGGAGGLAYLGEAGHLGVAYSGFDTRYGAVAEPEVAIDLRQRRWDAHGEWFHPLAGVRAVKVRFGHADYAHQELEGSEVGTVFTNRAYEGRLEVLHEKLGGLEGALGVQFARSNFAAEGAEAFLPRTVTTNQAVFLFEELAWGGWKWQWGARVERQEITPEAATGLPRNDRTGASFSAGVVRDLPGGSTVALNVSRSLRAPNAQELFADGPHLATGGFERGNPGLGRERALGLDLSLRRGAGFLTGAASVFLTEFDGYVFEQASGAADPVDGLPIFDFVQREARLYGGELELVAHLRDEKHHQADLRLTADWVRAEDRTDDEALPRTTPARLGLAFDYQRERFSFTAEARGTLRQSRLASGETPTGGFVLLNLAAGWRFKLGPADAELFARATNLGDSTARVHTSFLKDLAPLAGRDVSAGVRVAF